jgi:hypothetical protein
MFPNGTSYMDFNEAFCCRCTKYAPDSIPGEGKGCETKEAISTCSITGDKKDFPYKDLIDTGYPPLFTIYVCKHFDGETLELQQAYLALRQKYEKSA